MTVINASNTVFTAPLVGKIEYLDNKGKVFDYTNYEDADEFVQDIKDELMGFVDVEIAITVYRDVNGNHLPTAFINKQERQPASVKIIDAPIEVAL